MKKEMEFACGFLLICAHAISFYLGFHDIRLLETGHRPTCFHMP